MKQSVPLVKNTYGVSSLRFFQMCINSDMLEVETDIYGDYIKRNSLRNKVMRLIGFCGLGLWCYLMATDHLCGPGSYSKMIRKPPEVQCGVLTSVTSVRSVPSCFLLLQAADRGPDQLLSGCPEVRSPG